MAPRNCEVMRMGFLERRQVESLIRNEPSSFVGRNQSVCVIPSQRVFIELATPIGFAERRGPGNFLRDEIGEFLERKIERIETRTRGWGKQPWGTSPWGTGDTIQIVIPLDGFVEHLSVVFVERI